MLAQPDGGWQTFRPTIRFLGPNIPSELFRHPTTDNIHHSSQVGVHPPPSYDSASRYADRKDKTSDCLLVICPPLVFPRFISFAVQLTHVCLLIPRQCSSRPTMRVGDWGEGHRGHWTRVFLPPPPTGLDTACHTIRSVEAVLPACRLTGFFFFYTMRGTGGPSSSSPSPGPAGAVTSQVLNFHDCIFWGPGFGLRRPTWLFTHVDTYLSVLGEPPGATRFRCCNPLTD
ncbi:hypothetical protein LX32DRAFT_444102 [Colletotrichum zoysiae]|uniref:Uncharacterized protein n=1 Tax=Colletotrichum zoysiae TaxID=1216348 RepID=A0AAD9M9Q1_9PEZI|nr:hypothetical protein LX32DRAFT_444102 [Colletotrichum zoysiae]